jgi:PKD repeat protein
MGTKLRILTAAAAFAALAGCTVHKADKAPSLTGPSDNATSLQLQVTPDTIFQDGASQALVTISAFGPDGQPARNLSLLTQIQVGGATTDFGRLSARSLVTDANGKATVTYTAPPAPPIANGDGTIVGIAVTPLGTDFANSMSRVVTVRLIPTGTIGAPPTPLKTAIILPNAVVGDTAVFTANITDSTGADASSQVASFQWNFGDGSTATGRTVSHSYAQAGNYAVSLTILDALGRVGSTTQSLTVGGGTNPTASFFTTPSSPTVGQSVTFNAATATAAPGHSITSYAWDFGDGSLGGGQSTTHAYSAAGSYTVLLTTTDDVGRKGTSTQTISVGTAAGGGLSADFNFSPSSPAVGTNVSFDASTSSASTGRTITAYAWNFDDGTTGSGVQASHVFRNTGTFNVRLTITDDLGKTATTTKAVNVAAANPTASFTFSPSVPATNQTVTFDASASSPSPGRAIVAYQWNFDDGTTGTGRTTTHAFTTARSYLVRLTVTDDLGTTATTSNSVPVTTGTPPPAPTADFTFNPSAPTTNQPVQFDASASRAAQGRTITSYAWTFDDGTTGSGVTISHAFAQARSYQVRLTVTDDAGQTGTIVKPVTVTAGGTTPVASFTYSPNSPVASTTPITFNGSQSQTTAPSTISIYQWQFAGTPDPANNTCSVGRAAGTVFTQSTPTIQFTYASNGLGAGNYCVVLTVFDSQGGSNSTVRPITITP